MGIGWAKKMRDAFGASFLWLVSLIYFTQGFRSFVWTAVSYQMKDMLKLSPSASQLLVSVAYFPWSIKPLYGILSDCFPIRRRKRVPYLIVATVLSLIPWLILGLVASLRGSSKFLTTFLTVQNIGSAMADVVIDAMIAEAVRFEHAGLAGDLQSLSWSAMAFGGICGSLLGGYALTNMNINIIFLLFSLLPAMQLLSCAFIGEDPKGLKRALEPNGQNHNQVDNNFASGKSLTEPSKNGGTRRRKSSNKYGKKKTILQQSQIPEMEHSSISASSYISLISAVNRLCFTFRQPIILRPMAWFFFSNVMVPNLSTVLFYYQTEVLQLESSFLGTVRVIGWLSLMFGAYIYNCYLKHKRLRSILMFAHIGLALICFLDVVLVSQVHIQFGIPDKYMVLWGSAFGDAINQFKFMPFLILSGQLCPPGIEGTLFALFMSINNFSSTLGSFFGAALASVLDISSENFDNLLFGIVVQLVATLLPIAFLFLIPKEATGVASS
ncbi:probable folate-biopterin transporter 4 isoform X2 [Ananas comosus]|uniref:Probable folate-biopterin transporter 4 isoform X2 n=1 Tax=Ananas comosus TaxID=4615 RepID=A0A6P5FVI6_ANACO|nr:probable folate-biopterin transporter 4 isoform X2 [Ananas comosus]